MLYQFINKTLERWECIGVGTVINSDENVAKVKKTVKNIEYLEFDVCAGVVREIDKITKKFQVVKCCAYSNGNQTIYNLVQALKRGDLVFFAGYINEYLYKNDKGLTQKKQLCAIQWLQTLFSQPLTRKNIQGANPNEDDILF